MSKKKKILILGGYGFLGNNLYESLRQNYSIYRFGRYSINKKISLFNLKKIKKNFDIIIHCAGGSSVSNSIINPKDDFQKTVGSVKAVIKYIQLTKISPRIVYISSPAVFGDSIKKKILLPISPYGKNKLNSEKILINFAKKNKLDLNIVRLFSLYGEGQKKQLLWDIFHKSKKNDFIYYGNGSELRSWMHVSDAVNVIKLILLNSSKKKMIINAPGNEVFTNKQVVNAVYKYLNIKVKPIFNNITRKGDPKNLTFSNKDLDDLKWKQKIKFSLGLKQYIKWICNYK